MKLQDRIQAIARSPKYKEAYVEYLNRLKPEEHDIFSYQKGIGIICSPLSPAATELCRIYKIPFPVKPKDFIQPDTVLPEWIIKARESARKHDVFAMDDILNAPELPSIMIIAQKKRDGNLFWGPDDNTRWMTLSIDMMRPFDQIKNELKKVYGYFDSQNKFRPKERRDRESGLEGKTIFDIYDVVKKHNDNLYAAAQELGMENKPSDDSDSDKLYKQVVRAYKKAARQVKEIEDI